MNYSVPESAPDLITVKASCRVDSKDDWQPACIWPYVSETALRFMDRKDWEHGVLSGKLQEKYASGLKRTLVWNPFYIASGKCTALFRLILLTGEEQIDEEEIEVQLDNDDVIFIDDWSNVVQKDYVSENPEPGSSVWWRRTCQEGMYSPTGGASLEVKEKGIKLPQLTYPLHLSGYYAIFACLSPKLGCIELRLTGDERTQIFHSPPFYKGAYPRIRCERLWRWTDMSYQHLVIRQPYRTVYEYEDHFRANLDYLRLVPLDHKLIEELEQEWSSSGEKRVFAAYNEPYSWAFFENIQTPLSHWESILPFAEARTDIVNE